MKSTTKATYNEDVLKSKKTVLLDVWAPWCGPCRGMEPILEDIEKETEDWAEIIKIDASKDMELAQDLGVSGLPAYFVYNQGSKIGSTVGATTKAKLISLMEQTR